MNNPLPSINETTVREALRAVVDPELSENIVDLGMVRSIQTSGSVVTIEIALTIAGCPLRDQLRRDCEMHVGAVDGVEQVEIVIGSMSKNERTELMARARRAAQDRTVDGLPTNTRVLAIASGKGGVGKSSITANLAAALAQRGFSVGLLDGDIWGFSIPRLLGVEGPLEVRNQKMVPKHRRIGKGVVKIVSMGFLSGEDEAIMWRGLVLNRALQHFLEDVEWGSIDYLLIDMPPGTGDVQMGLARMVPRTELLIVTTPALGAQKVAGRAADMARKGNLRIAGVIENMSGFICDHDSTYALFGEGGGRRLADEIGVPLVASIPLDPRVARAGDSGEPLALDPTSPAAAVFSALADAVATEIAPLVAMTGCSARLLDAMTEALSSTGTS